MTAETRERPSLHRAVLIVLVIGGLFLGGCDGKRAKPAAAPQHYDRLPDRTGEQASYELLDALLGSPVTVALPPGFTAQPPQEGTIAFPLQAPILHLPPQYPMPSGVLTVLKHSSQGGIIGFFVFHTAAEAEAAFRTVEAARRPPDYDAFTPAGFDAPAACRPEPAPPVAALGPGGSTHCLVLAGNVIVAGSSRLPDDPGRGNDEVAIALARVALAHLQAVQGALARTASETPARHPVRVGILADVYWRQIPMGFFRDRLAALGWTRGRDLAIEYRFADGQRERLPEMAAELVRKRVDVIVSVHLGAARAARDAAEGSGIPIVFILTDGDPVAEGLVPSLARPGPTITGVAFPITISLAAKRLDLLAEALPDVSRVGVLIEATDGPPWRELEETARARGIELLPQVIRDPADIPAAVEAAKAAGAQALLQADDNTTYGNTAFALNTSATQHGLPVVFNRFNLGGILSYAPSPYVAHARGAEYVDLVLRGTPPAQLPVELVRDYELTLSLNVSQRLGLTIAPSLLARVTEVFEPAKSLAPRRVR